MKLWQSLQKVLKSEKRAALVLVKRVMGSVPRGVGAGLVVLEDGSFYGTIGGGALEWKALQHAVSIFKANRKFDELDIPLGPAIGQCCGGFVSLSFELWDVDRLSSVAPLATAEAKGKFSAVSERTEVGNIERTLSNSGQEQFGNDTIPVALFGAGHVGKATMLSLALLPVEMSWVDTRSSLFPDKIPSNVALHCPKDPSSVLSKLNPASAIIIMTHSHSLDLEILAASLKLGFPYIGVIGSNTKRKRFEGLLMQSGMGKTLATSFTCPIGLIDIAGKEPAIIAASVTAQILMEMTGNAEI